MKLFVAFLLIAAAAFAADPDIIVHKQVTPISGDLVKVKLTVENHADKTLKNLVVVEFVGNGIVSALRPLTIKESTQLKWNIDALPIRTKRIYEYALKSGETDAYPQVLGIDPSRVHLTLSTTETIQEEIRIFQRGEEYITTIIIAIIIVIFLLVWNHRKQANV